MPPFFDLALHHRLQRIAAETLEVLAQGHYKLNGTPVSLSKHIEVMREATELEPDASMQLERWKERDHSLPSHTTRLTMSLNSTLVSLRRLAAEPGAKVAVLNFANAETPGGGFEHGAQAQEESLVRSSTLYASLTSPRGRPFYESHLTVPSGLYKNAMIWSPRAHFFRADDGTWLDPVEADVVTSPAVNANEVRFDSRDKPKAELEEQIAAVMRERMARILCLLEIKQSTHLVLGSFGTGAFGNDVATIAQIWRDLLGPGRRFERSFPVVDFAIIDQRTYDLFRENFFEESSPQ